MNYQNQPTSDYGIKGTADYASPAVERPPSPLSQRFAELEDLAKQFHAIAHGFDNKLNTVLNPQMANGVGAEKATPKPIVAPLTERLDSLIAEMRAATVRLNDIQDRIAL